MNYNIAAYIVFLIMMIFLIGFVGRLFHRNGRVFILALMKDDAVRTDHLNNMLLVAYYLFNIGYTFVKLRFWQKIENMETLISSIAANMSVLIFILASTHYLNMLLIWQLSRSEKSSFINKIFQS
jgi:hypothetical protein